jgi:hypothetical protein
MFLRQPLSLLGLSLVLIGGCGPSNSAIESLQSKILEDVVSQGGNSLKSVICPADQAKAESFTCTGVLASGNGFDIAVKSQAGENHVWEIVSINGLLNMSQLQAAIQSGLTTELGTATIDCGTSTTYKATQPGEQFECQVSGTKPSADTKKADADPSKTKGPKPEKVVVTIAAGGNISWQRILPEGKATGDKAKDSSDKAKDSGDKVKDSGDKVKDSGDKAKDSAIDPKTTANKPESKPTDAAQPDAAPAQSAEAALDAGGTDALED